MHFNIMTKHTSDFDKLKNTLMQRYKVSIDDKKKWRVHYMKLMEDLSLLER